MTVDEYIYEMINNENQRWASQRFFDSSQVKEIVGAAIAGDLYRYHHRHPYDASCPPNANPIFDLLDEMDNVFIVKDFGQELQLNLVLQMQLTAASSKHSGKSITSQLNTAMINYEQNEKDSNMFLLQQPIQ
ncbi:unnamed protein product [Rotaria socialis]